MTGHCPRLLTLLLPVLLFAACGKTESPLPDEPPVVVSLVPMPSTLQLTSESTLRLGWGAAGTVSFSMRPQSALEGLDLEQIAGMLSLEGRTGDAVTGYVMDKLQRSGENFTATVTDLCSRGFYADNVVLVYRRTDEKGRVHQVRSDPFTIVSEAFRGPRTGLPVVFADTPDAQPVVSKEEWINQVNLRIFNPDGSLSYEGTTGMKGRGNSTWTQFPKKPYALKLDVKAEILGMPKHKRWCLLANWMDRTLIRNAVAFEIARRTDLAWTPSGRFVELVLNGKHVGNYYLCEQVKVDKNRVNIADLAPDAVDGGYLMELDDWFDEAFKFRSPVHDVPWQFKDPDEITQAQFDFMYNYVKDFEEALYDDTRFAAREYTEYIDSGSWADWWLVNELAQNGDVNFPKSVYLHKDAGGKLVAGPVWDFDWGTFIPQESYNYSCRGPKFYLNRICIGDRQFRATAKTRWARYREALSSIPASIDSLAALLAASDALNIAMWPIDRETNGDQNLSHSAAVTRLKRAYQEKYNWLDNQIMNTNTF